MRLGLIQRSDETSKILAIFIILGFICFKCNNFFKQQVERRKCAEAERLHLVEKARTEALERKVQELEAQLFSTNVENDAIKEKFTGIVSDREEQIKKLNVCKI